jgi:hypothetical protein
MSVINVCLYDTVSPETFANKQTAVVSIFIYMMTNVCAALDLLDAGSKQKFVLSSEICCSLAI